MAAIGIHHLGLAVENLDEAISTYERLFGAELEERAMQDEQGVEAASLRVGPLASSPGHVELLSALGPDTPVGRFLSRRGPGMHHVAYEVEDLPGELARLEGEGAELIDRAPRPGLFGMQVAFVHPDSLHGVLSELVQRGGTHGSSASPLLEKTGAGG
jgi:methylmalonyl-CoA/ethylmalonyl-CoA epimerase